MATKSVCCPREGHQKRPVITPPELSSTFLKYVIRVCKSKKRQNMHLMAFLFCNNLHIPICCRNFATDYQRIIGSHTRTINIITDESICTYISLAAYKRKRLAMRQCILLYVLLLLFYPWVMPDTRMYESISSIFLYLLVIPCAL